MPTFCRGWGKLPFDRSGTDLTAHAVSAWQAWQPELGSVAVQNARARAKAYLSSHQNTDGSWTPLWFGNEHAKEQQNPTFGTARVLPCLAGGQPPAYRAGEEWLGRTQNADGGWGGGPGTGSSIEETSLAITALAATDHPALPRAVAWLIEQTREGTETSPAPIGLYFASLWYHEALYPLIFATGAITRSCSLLRS